MAEEQKELKRFSCCNKDACNWKQHYVNQRCFAPYAIRQTCPSVMRKDGKAWFEGSREDEVKVS